MTPDVLHRVCAQVRGDRADAAEHVPGHHAGNTDRRLDFSTPLTGILFFVPTRDFFDQD